MMDELLFLRIMLFLSMCWNTLMFFNIRKLEDKIDNSKNRINEK